MGNSLIEGPDLYHDIFNRGLDRNVFPNIYSLENYCSLILFFNIYCTSSFKNLRLRLKPIYMYTIPKIRMHCARESK